MKNNVLENKNIIVGVCGGIACYKVASLVSLLKKEGANVDVVMTKNATQFITPLTFQTLSQNPVVIDMFELFKTADVKHISLSQKADAVIVAPATANIIGKVVNGIADDMLSTVLMATTAPIVFAPAMNNNMFNNKIVQDNIKKLKDYGYHFVEPEVGYLACGTNSVGRLADIKNIVEKIKEVI